MFESVLLPAPFSPRSACTSPSSASKSTRSLARTPGNRFVIPRHAIAGRASRPAEATVCPAVGSIGLGPWRGSAPRRSPADVLLALRAPDDALHEPVHRVEVGQDLEGRALRDLQLPALVVERPGEDV